LSNALLKALLHSISTAAASNTVRYYCACKGVTSALVVGGTFQYWRCGRAVNTAEYIVLLDRITTSTNAIYSAWNLCGDR
jgi:hypothetical protein